MASIGSDRMIVHGEQRDDNSWLFTVCYTAYFADADLGQRFDDMVAIREADSQRLAGAEHAVCFTATSTRVFRKKRIVVHENTVDAVCALIRLHRVAGSEISAASPDDEQRTPGYRATA